ncbi:MAG TPA: ABC transporter ATP-binding protein [Tepidisphaeraceae bacterium]|nr:ABC transporter ATP-binding protein [Tepidisphaeraceae bacterium]
MAEDRLHDDDAFHPRINLALWRGMLRFARPYARHLLGLSALAVVCAACDVTLPWVTGRFVDEITRHGAQARLGAIELAYGAVIATLGVAIFVFIVLAGRITTGVSYDIRAAAFDKLQELPFSFYDRKAVGWLMARLTSDVGSLSRIMGWALLDLVWGTIVLTSVAAVMFALNWRLALIVLTVVPPLVWVSRYFQVRLLRTSRALRKANSHTTAAFNEGIVGVRTSKSFVREERNLDEFRDLTDQMYRHAVSNALYSALFLPVVLGLCSVGIGLALWRGGIDVGLGTISLGTLVMFLQYAGFIQNPAQELANMLTQVQGAQASAERIQGLLDTPVEIRDSPELRAAIEAHHASPNRDSRLAPDGYPNRIETIEFRDVGFAYKEGQAVLDNFNLTVKAGQSIALVGPTGGGKSTIVSLVCRFYEPTAGQVLINGVDYRQRSLHWLQSNLGMVLQQPHLFTGTIRDNIRYGRLDATDSQIEHAARLVNAHEFIAAMKDGYDSQVGEGGNQLSTGQKQLVALARAVIAEPQLFVMDEATSSVDTQTERLIQSAVDRVLRNRISFVIAHRLSTIRSASRILVIDSGQIIEDGTHHQLIRRRGRYFELYTSQFTSERESQLLDTQEVAEQVAL